ncbi:MAG: type II secretion system protein GspD [Gallionellales bacterium RIFCSPHIGHO2_02_FULL_57_16]|nr:MAG: type II secretion system protein GspD [Gallionellales bacterium RIFCSPHIGHO2_02_FULL_57_16]
MIKNRLAGWRCWSAAFILLCAMAGMQPVQAQDSSANVNTGTNEATGATRGTLNFVDADIESVIAAIGDYTNTTFIIDPRVKGKVNLVSEESVTKAQAFQLLTSVLRLHGYSVVTGNGYAKVVPEADAKLQAGHLQSSSGQAGTVRGDQIATQIFRLNHESAVNLVTVLRPLISPNNTINANPGNNTLVITDYADNLLRLGKIITAMDGPASSELDVVSVRHAIASDIAVMVNRLLEPGGVSVAGGDAGRTGLLADSRTNAVIVRAPSEARANLAKALIAKLDQPTAQPGNVHVVYLKNAEAAKLAQTLRAVVSADPSAPVAAPSSAAGASPATPAQTPQGSQAGFIQADPSTNTLIITASEPVYRNLRMIIDQLDARRAQVYIESLIVEVTDTQAAAFGVQWANITGGPNSDYRAGIMTGFGTGGDNLTSQVVAKTATGNFLPPSNGLSIGIFRQAAGKIGLGALAQMLQSGNNANILSMPNMITLDNEEAKIIVGKNVPFLTGQYTTTASGGAAGVNPFQTIERKDIGLSLRVRPQISEGGSVKMAIYQEISSVQDMTGATGIITNKRSVDTNVLVDDGQIIVLGGLIDESLQDGVEKVPGLGDIPIVGNLFKYQKRNRVKTNLMVFLRPTVIRSNEQSMNLTADRYSFIRNLEIDAQPAPSPVLPDMKAPQLPPLQDGQMTGGLLFNRIDSGPLFNKTWPALPAPGSDKPEQPAAPSSE